MKMNLAKGELDKPGKLNRINGQRKDEMFLTLSKNFAIKGYNEGSILFNLVTGEKYELGKDQVDFILLCDGNATFAELIQDYGQGSKKTVLDFIKNLETIGAVECSQNSRPRVIYVNTVPELRLQLVHLEATSRCNMCCLHCYQGEMYPVKENLDIEEIVPLVRAMQIMQVESIGISGGEPFTDPKTLDIAKCAEEHDIRVSSFFTNGTLLNEELIEEILVLRSNPTFYVSVDSITPEGMIFRGVEDITEADKIIDRIFRNIKVLVERGIRVVVNTVMNTCNIDGLKRMHDTMEEFRVSSWRVGYPKKTGFFKDNQEFAVDFEKTLQASFDLLQHHFIKGSPFDLQIEYLYRRALLDNFKEVKDNDFVCDYESRRESCCIKPNGDVVACAYCNQMPVGNIRKETLWDIWYSNEMQTIKNTRVKDVSECADCELRSFCAAGCRANAYFLNGDFKNGKDNYACKAVQFFRNNVVPLLERETNFKISNLIPGSS